MSGQAFLWDLANDRLIGEPYKLDNPVDMVRISQDGKKVLASDGRTTQLWSTTGGQSVTLKPSGEFVFSPDGRRVFLIESRGEVGQESIVGTIWDTETGKQDGSEFHLPLIYRGAIWAPGGESLLTIGEGDVTLWDSNTGQAIAGLDPKRTDRWVVDYGSLENRNGEPDLSGFDQDAYYHRSNNFGFRFSTDGRFILGAADVFRTPAGYSWAWNVMTRTVVKPSWLLPDERSLAVGYSPEGKIAFTTSFTEVVRAWDLKNGQPVGEPLRHPFRVWSVDISADGGIVVTGGADKVARIWDRTGGTAPVKLDQSGAVFAVAISPDGRHLLTGSGDNNARLWNVQSRTQTHRPFMNNYVPYRVAFGAERTVLTKSRDGTRVWELARGPESKESQRPVPEYRRTKSRDGRTVSNDRVYLDLTVEVFDANGKPIGKPFRHPDRPILGGMGGTISPDGKTLLTVHSAGNAYIWDVDDGKLRFSSPISTETKDIAFLDDGKAITVQSDRDGSVVIWDVKTGKSDGELLKHGGPVTCIAIGPEGKTLLTGGPDKVLVWDLRTRLPVGPPLELASPARDIGVDPGNGHPAIVVYDEARKTWEWPFPAPWRRTITRRDPGPGLYGEDDRQRGKDLGPGRSGPGGCFAPDSMARADEPLRMSNGGRRGFSIDIDPGTLVFNGIDNSTGEYLLLPQSTGVNSTIAHGELLHSRHLEELGARGNGSARPTSPRPRGSISKGFVPDRLGRHLRPQCRPRPP